MSKIERNRPQKDSKKCLKKIQEAGRLIEIEKNYNNINSYSIFFVKKVSHRAKIEPKGNQGRKKVSSVRILTEF